METKKPKRSMKTSGFDQSTLSSGSNKNGTNINKKLSQPSCSFSSPNTTQSDSAQKISFTFPNSYATSLITTLWPMIKKSSNLFVFTIYKRLKTVLLTRYFSKGYRRQLFFKAMKRVLIISIKCYLTLFSTLARIEIRLAPNLAI